jgi:hypothetical protein
MRMKARTKKTTRSQRSASPNTFVRYTRTLSTRAKVVAVIGILSTGVLISGMMARARQEAAFKNAASTPVASPVVASRIEPAAIEANAAIAEPVAAERPQKTAAVTITGCLERNAEAFRLKDTAGASAPRARSWKSGFLKKGSATVAVIDAGNRVKLPTHVGQRVSVTGTLVDREMQVRSLQRVATSCSVKS